MNFELDEAYLRWYQEVPSSIDLAEPLVEVLDKEQIALLEKWLTRMCQEHGRTDARFVFFKFNRKTTQVSAMGSVIFGLDRRFKTLSGVSALCRQLLWFLGKIGNQEPELAENVLIELFTFSCLEAVFGTSVSRRASSHIDVFETAKVSDLEGRFNGWLVLAVLEKKRLINQISLNSTREEINNLIEQILHEEIEFNEYLLLQPRIVEFLTSKFTQTNEPNRA